MDGFELKIDSPRHLGKRCKRNAVSGWMLVVNALATFCTEHLLDLKVFLER
jgi:hypothetical protein